MMPNTTASSVVITSFGYGHAPAPAADVICDVRTSLRNPHHDPAMRNLTGLDPAVRAHVLNTPGAPQLVHDTVRGILDRHADSVAIGCVGGRHRAAALAQEIGDQLAAAGREVTVVHRDVDKPLLPSRAHQTDQDVVDAFNRDNEPGACVRYWTGLRAGAGKVSTTRSKAEVLSGHTPVVWVEGVVGAIALTPVEPIPHQPDTEHTAAEVTADGRS